ncbi:hypothetical protein [Kushneria sp. EE4]
MNDQEMAKIEQETFNALLEEKEQRTRGASANAPASRARLQILHDWQKQTSELLDGLAGNDTALEAIEQELVTLDRAYECNVSPEAMQKNGYSAQTNRPFDEVETAASVLALRIIREGVHPLKSKGDAYRHLSFVLENEPRQQNLDVVWFVYRFVHQDEQASIVELLEQHEQTYRIVAYQQDVFQNLVEQAEMRFLKKNKGKGLKYCSSTFRQHLAMDAFRPAMAYFYSHDGLVEWVEEQAPTTHQWIAVLDGDYFITAHAWRRLNEDLIALDEDTGFVSLPVSEVNDREALLSGYAPQRPGHSPQGVFRYSDFVANSTVSSMNEGQTQRAGWIARLDIPESIDRSEQRFNDAFLAFARSVSSGKAVSSEPNKRFVFGIPVRPRVTTKNWDTVCSNLQRTLYNLARQTLSDFRVLVACHEIPDIETYGLDIEFLIADYEPSTNEDGKYIGDKGKKKRLINAALSASVQNDCYYMPLDADDLVHPELVENTLTDDNRRGYLIDSGFMYDLSQDSVALCEPQSFPFWTRCGSCAVFYLTVDDLPISRGDNEAYLVTLKSHADFPELARLRGRELEPFTQHMAVYLTGHSENSRLQYQQIVRRGKSFMEEHIDSNQESLKKFKYQFPEVMFFTSAS